MTRIDRYRIFAEIQRGPITTVYKAYQEDLGRVVLLKVLHRDLANDPELVDRLRREGRACAQVRHANVVSVFDFGLADGVPYLVIEFVEGKTLADLVSEVGSFPSEIAVFVAREVAAGLAAVHARGLVHRDVKPANIFLSEEGEVRLGDFGFTVLRPDESEAAAGTPGYLAPEVVKGQAVGPQADLFALGVTLYEMLSGHNPFADRSASRTLHHIVNLDPPPLRQRRPEVPLELDALCQRLLAKDPEQRPQSAVEVKQKLAAIQTEQGMRVGPQEMVQFVCDPKAYSPEVSASTKSTGETLQKGSTVNGSEGLSGQLQSERPEHGTPAAWRRRFGPVVVAAVVVAVAAAGILVSRNGGLSVSEPKSLQDNLGPAEAQPALQNSVPSREESSATEGKRVTSSMPAASQAERRQQKSPEPVMADTVGKPEGPEPTLGWLHVASDPRAVVWLNRDSVGVTPLAAAVEGGDHQLCLQPPGWPRVCKAVTVAAAETLRLQISLWQEVSYLQVDVAPWGEIWVDGRFLDETPLQQPAIISSGEHVLEVRHPALGGRVERFSIAPGDTLRRRFHLQPANP